MALVAGLAANENLAAKIVYRQAAAAGGLGRAMLVLMIAFPAIGAFLCCRL